MDRRLEECKMNERQDNLRAWMEEAQRHSESVRRHLEQQKFREHYQRKQLCSLGRWVINRCVREGGW